MNLPGSRFGACRELASGRERDPAGPVAAIDLLCGWFANSHRDNLGLGPWSEILLLATEGLRDQ